MNPLFGELITSHVAVGLVLPGGLFAIDVDPLMTVVAERLPLLEILLPFGRWLSSAFDALDFAVHHHASRGQ